MAQTVRRVPPPSAQTYSAVPTSPRRSHSISGSISGTIPSRQQSAQMQPGRGAMAQGIATGNIGGGYGPYSYNPNQGRDNGVYNQPRFSANASEVSTVTTEHQKQTQSTHTAPVAPYMWDTKDPDLDDVLHNPDPIRDAALDKSFTIFSLRGWINAFTLFALMMGLIILFAGYPIISYATSRPSKHTGYNIGGINSTGQIPDLPNLPSIIDPQTDSSAYTRVGTDGKKYSLVFSDEFNTDGRSFYPGDDPFWEAADLQYWPTGDLEWYDPSAITTENGKLVITLSQKNTHDLNFMSGMLTTWNKLCFTTGYIEVSVSMPGSPNAAGLWPAAWTMGNLGRAGYGATTEGMWPYSYDSCDLGTFPNQTSPAGVPQAAATGGIGGGPLSYLPGQRLSSCSCPGSDHPGPTTHTGRGVPEIDIFETQVNVSVFEGQVSQSYQIAPYNYQYQAITTPPAATIFDDTISALNSYKGGVYQQAVSAVTDIDSSLYNGQAFASYGYEWWSDPNHRDQSYVTWFSNGKKSWSITNDALGPDPVSQVGQRIISEEPMYILLNLGLSPSFQKQDWAHLTFPSKMYVDYVRVYQRDGVRNGVTCDPPNRPTADYINSHLNAYSNANLTTWAQANYTFPRNSLLDNC